MILALAGNPNSGKTTLFNALTGLSQHVGNFPGVTVERMEGALRLHPSVTVVDLPGMYSLTALSREEEVSRAYLKETPPDAVINIVDATCPERGLYLTVQLLETGLPLVVAMNMMDEVEKAGGKVDCAALSGELGVAVLPLAASRGEGVSAVARAALLAKPPRWKGLSGGGESEEERIVHRYAYVSALVRRAVRPAPQSRAQRRSMRLDAVLTHRLLSFPIFFSIMALVFYLTFGPVGGTLNGLFRRALEAATLGVSTLLIRADAPAFLYGMVVQGVLTGVGSVLSFLPTILTLFFFLSLLEDSGYMARMAYITDRLLRKLGLTGRSFVPALLGFGCSVPAILATRTLPTARDRKLTILLVPFMSCSAKLPIYAVFCQAFFPKHAALFMLFLYIGAVLTGIAALCLINHAVPKSAPPPFVLELPAYRLPTARSAFLLVKTRTAAFLRCALTTLLIASIGVFALQRIDWSLAPVADNAQSALASIGRAVAPLFTPLGFGDWRAATSLLSGLMAKEGVLSCLSVLLGAPDGAALQAALMRVFTPLSAVSFLVFTLLYMPCVAAFAAARRELGGFRYALAAAAFQTGVAWLAALVVYNGARLLGLS